MGGRACGCFMVMVALAISTTGCTFEDGESEEVAETSAAAQKRKTPSSSDVRRARGKLQAAKNKTKDAKARARALGRDGTERKIERVMRRLEAADGIGARIERLVSSLRGLRPNTSSVGSISENVIGEVDGYNDALAEAEGEAADAQRELEGKAETARILNDLAGAIQDIGDAILD